MTIANGPQLIKDARVGVITPALAAHRAATLAANNRAIPIALSCLAVNPRLYWKRVNVAQRLAGLAMGRRRRRTANNSAGLNGAALMPTEVLPGNQRPAGE